MPLDTCPEPLWFMGPTFQHIPLDLTLEFKGISVYTTHRMITVWFYAILSVLIVSAASIGGILLLSLKQTLLQRILTLLMAVAAGTFFGDAFIHLLPESAEGGFGVTVSLAVLTGITVFFIVEKYIHWHHCHKLDEGSHVHHFAIMNLLGDAVHNMIDGLVIGASYLISIPVGIATTIAVFIHEIPQEVSDFAILMHGGFSKGKALFYNFLVALGAVLGVVIALVIGAQSEKIAHLMIPFAAGAFIYIGGADLIPELQKETSLKKSLIQLLAFIVGIAIMMALTFVEVM